MKLAILLLVIVGCLADDKPGECPDEVQSGGQSCTTDFDCQALDKCCNQQCVAPECDDDAPKCLVNPCDSASCPAVPEAVCYPDTCSEDCGAVWLTTEDDVTDLCVDEEDEDDVDDDDDNEDDDDENLNEDDEREEMPRGDRKSRRRNKKQKGQHKKHHTADKTSREEWLARVQDKRNRTLSRLNAKGKLDKVAMFQRKWEAKDEGRANQRQDNRQKIKAMSPEQRKAFWAEKRARKMERMEAKVEKKHKATNSGSRGRLE